MEVGGKLHVLAASTPGKEPPAVVKDRSERYEEKNLGLPGIEP
jgi:hypothetical protein